MGVVVINVQKIIFQRMDIICLVSSSINTSTFIESECILLIGVTINQGKKLTINTLKQ